MAKQQRWLTREGPTLRALGVEMAQSLSPLRVRPMTPEEGAGFEARAAEREWLSRTGVFECKREARP